MKKTEKIQSDAAWIREQLVKLTDTESYAVDAAGDQDLVEDFEITVGEYARRQERASLSRIRERFVEGGALTARRDAPERPVSLPWLHGN